MATYRYTVKKGPNEVVEGTLEADSRAQALVQLTGLGYTPVRIVEAANGHGPGAQAAEPPAGIPGMRGRVPPRHLNAFTRQFASLTRSGVPLLRSLTILSDQGASPRLQQVLTSLTEQVRKGDPLSTAMSQFPQVFSPFYLSLIRAGEVGGVLDTVLDRLADKAERDEALRSKMQSAMAYPLFVVAVGLGTVVFLLSFVLPRLLRLFEGFGERLPLPTRMLLSTSHVMSSPWFWTLTAVAVGGTTLAAFANPGGARLALERLLWSFPPLRRVIRDAELAGFARAFGLLLAHGVPVLQAVRVAIGVVHHHVIRSELATLTQALEQGGSLAASLKTIPIVPAFMVNTVSVGEEGGRAAEALNEVATTYERDTERAIQVMSSLLEPAMMLIVGALVGWIVMAVLLPIFELGTIV